MDDDEANEIKHAAMTKHRLLKLRHARERYLDAGCRGIKTWLSEQEIESLIEESAQHSADVLNMTHFLAIDCLKQRRKQGSRYQSQLVLSEIVRSSARPSFVTVVQMRQAAMDAQGKAPRVHKYFQVLPKAPLSDDAIWLLPSIRGRSTACWSDTQDGTLLRIFEELRELDEPTFLGGALRVARSLFSADRGFQPQVVLGDSSSARERVVVLTNSSARVEDHLLEQMIPAVVAIDEAPGSFVAKDASHEASRGVTAYHVQGNMPSSSEGVAATCSLEARNTQHHLLVRHGTREQGYTMARLTDPKFLSHIDASNVSRLIEGGWKRAGMRNLMRQEGASIQPASERAGYLANEAKRASVPSATFQREEALCAGGTYLRGMHQAYGHEEWNARPRASAKSFAAETFNVEVIKVASAELDTCTPPLSISNAIRGNTKRTKRSSAL